MGDEVDFNILVAKEYETGMSRGSEFFSKTSPLELYALITQFTTFNGAPKFSNKNFKMRVNYSKEGKEVTYTVKILKVDETKHCVQFAKESGDFFEFKQIIKDCKEYLGGHVNATLDD